jgi:hypothetical protein
MYIGMYQLSTLNFQHFNVNISIIQIETTIQLVIQRLLIILIPLLSWYLAHNSYLVSRRHRLGASDQELTSVHDQKVPFVKRLLTRLTPDFVCGLRWFISLLHCAYSVVASLVSQHLCCYGNRIHISCLQFCRNLGTNLHVLSWSILLRWRRVCHHLCMGNGGRWDRCHLEIGACCEECLRLCRFWNLPLW